jgi:Carboxypeptidase regulatory-like domain/TonB dependent receptor-like, beta-barrel
MRNSKFSAIAIFILLFISIRWTAAQTAVDGAVGGTVLDSSGAAVSGATVTVQNNETNAEQTTVTDASGYFRAVHLHPGSYNVTIAAAGFDTFKSVNLTVQVGLLTDVEARLKVGSTTQVVEVSGQTPLINTTSADFAGVVNQVTVNDLPENNYRWSAFALLTPGVVNDSNGYGLLSWRGQSTLLNNITVEGTDDNQAYFSEERGRTRAGYSTIKAAVQEFQVNTSNYSVEYGRSAGGIVNMVTKSGTNGLHGQGYYFDRDSAWAATNAYVTHPVEISTNPIGYSTVPFKPTDLRRQYGFAVGGPIVKNRLFFFVAADRFYHDFPAAATILSPSANANFYNTSGSFAAGQQKVLAGLTGLSASAAAAVYNNGITGLISMLGTTPRTGDQTIYFPKLDWQINLKNHLSVEGNSMRWASPAGIQTSPAVAYGMASFGNDYVRDNWIVGKLNTFLGNNLNNEARYMYGRDFEFEFNQQPTQYEQSNLLNTPSYTNPLGLPPNVYLSGYFQFGTPQFLNRAALPDERKWQLADSVEWLRGNHDFKFGADYMHTYDLISNLYNQYGGYTYSGNNVLADYFADLYLSANPTPGKTTQNFSYFNQGTGRPGLDFTTGDYAFFAQDQWKVNSRLSLTLGVRWDYEQFPSPQLPNGLLSATSRLPDHKDNFSPRLGFAYNHFGTENTVLRGGFGLFYGRAINSTLYQALIGTGALGSQVNPNLYPGGTCSPLFPQVVAPANFSSCLGSSSGNATAYYLDPNFKLPEILQGDLTVQQMLTKDDVLSISWLGSFGRRLPDFVDTNLPSPTPVVFTVKDANQNAPLLNGSTITANTFLGSRPNPNFSTITDIFSGVTSSYQALVGEFKHRMSHYVLLDSSFTWSHALDYGQNNTTGAAATALLDPTNIRLDYGNSNQNVPDRFIVYAVADSPWHVHGPLGYLVNDFQMSPDLQVQSGLPYSLSISGDESPLYVTSGQPTTAKLINTSSFNGSGGANRVPGVNRNLYQQPQTTVLDLRLSKRLVIREHYNLEFLAEAFNLANHQNVTAVEGIAYAVSADKTNHLNDLVPYSIPYRSITSTNNSNFAYNIRQIQMAVRFQF